MIAALASLGLILAGRLLGTGWLGGIAGGSGVVAGWVALTGPPRLGLGSFSLGSFNPGRFDLAATSLAPHAPIGRLVPLALAAVAAGLVLGLLAPRRGRLAALLALAAACGWWLAGAPLARAGLVMAWPAMLAIALLAVLVQRLTPSAEAVSCGGAALAAALYLVHAPPLWPMLALVPAASALALVVLPAAAGPALPALTVDLAAIIAVPVLAEGRLAQGGFAAMETAALAPLLALWLLARITPRLGFAGRLAGPAAAVLAAGGAATAAGFAAAWSGLR